MIIFYKFARSTPTKPEVTIFAWQEEIIFAWQEEIIFAWQEKNPCLEKSNYPYLWRKECMYI
jgi:hypothetical protein